MANRLMFEVTNFNNLNDNVLLKCFGFLSVDELCTVKAVCKRFRQAANKSFKRRYADSIQFDDLIFNIQDIVRVIRCFGSQIRSVIINGSVMWDLNLTILLLLHENCENLKKLRLICFNFDKSQTVIMKNLVQRLETIELYYCTIESVSFGVNYNVMFKRANKIKELVMIGQNQEIDVKFLNKTWPHMEKLELFSVSVTDEEVLGSFLRKNRSVKYFGYMPNVNCTGEWVESCNSYIPSLVDLSIQLKKPSVQYVDLFNELRHLRRIAINCYQNSNPIIELVNILAKFRKLEVFSLWCIHIDRFFNFPELNVKTLELREMIIMNERKSLVIELIHRWEGIENLYVDHTIIRHADDLGVFVKNLHKLKNLYLCEMKGFFIMPTSKQFELWCTKRPKKLNIFIDEAYLPRSGIIHGDQKIVFKPFKNRMSQMVNVLCSAHL